MASIPVMDEKLLSLQDVADILSVDVKTVRRMVERGDMRSVKVGGRLRRIARSELDAYIERIKALSYAA